jgi:uncharacterized RDD family membrane protein YckC
MFCRECGTQNESSSMFCVKCGATLSAGTPAQPSVGTPASSRSPLTPSPSAPNFPATVPAPPPAAQSEAQQIVSGAALAGMGDRAIAAVLDSVVIAFLMVAVGMWAAAHWGGITPSGFELRGIAAFFTFSSVSILWFLYYWMFEGLFGTTLGKLVMNLRVVRVDGSKIDLRKSLIRNLLRLIDAIGVYLVGFLVAVLSQKRQRLGDHAAGTIVAQRDAAKAVRVAATVACATVIVACFITAYKLHVGAPVTTIEAGQISLPGDTGRALNQQTRPATPGPRVARAEMGTDSTENYQIIGASSEFYSDTPQIVCVWNIEGIDPGTLIKSVWIAEDVGEGAPPNYQIAEKSITGLNEGKFFMTIPTNGWPIGKYRMEIYIGDNLAKQLPFTVKQR